MGKPKKFIITRPDDERMVISYGRIELASLSHDSDGWDGMKRATDLVEAIARVLKIRVMNQ